MKCEFMLLRGSANHAFLGCTLCVDVKFMWYCGGKKAEAVKDTNVTAETIHYLIQWYLKQSATNTFAIKQQHYHYTLSRIERAPFQKHSCIIFYTSQQNAYLSPNSTQ